MTGTQRLRASDAQHGKNAPQHSRKEIKKPQTESYFRLEKVEETENIEAQDKKQGRRVFKYG